jgi:hypothetical protein
LRELLSAIFNFKYGVVSQFDETSPLISINYDHVLATQLQKTHYRTVDQPGQGAQQDVNGTKPVAK